LNKTRKTETTVELHEVVIVRACPAVSEPCADCLPAAGVLVSAEVAAAMTGTSVRAVFRCLEAGLIHYREVHPGRVLVCINSLAACVGPASGRGASL
jgi:hypothetical protein